MTTRATSRAQGVDMTGQKIQVTVSATTGGALDIYARLVAQHIARFIPGNPSTVAVNMPGAGGMIEINWLYNVAPKDGTVFGSVPMSGVFASVLGDSQAHYDAQMAKDPAFLGDAAKVGAEITPASGDDIEALSQRIYAYPPDIIARATAEYKKASGE